MAGRQNSRDQWHQHEQRLEALIEESIPLLNTRQDMIYSLGFATCFYAQLGSSLHINVRPQFAAWQRLFQLTFLSNDMLRTRAVEQAFAAFNADTMILSSKYHHHERDSEVRFHLRSNLTLQREKYLQLVIGIRQQRKIFEEFFSLNGQPLLLWDSQSRKVKELERIGVELKQVFQELASLVAEHEAIIYCGTTMIVFQRAPRSAAQPAPRSRSHSAQPLCLWPDIQADPELVRLDEELERRFITESVKEQVDDTDSELGHGEYSESDQNGDTGEWEQAEDEPVILGPGPFAESLWSSVEDEDRNSNRAADHRLRRPLQRMKLPPLRPGERYRRLSSTSDGSRENSSESDERRPIVELPPVRIDPDEVIAEPGPVRLRGE